jgi:hypothetical protein
MPKRGDKERTRGRKVFCAVKFRSQNSTDCFTQRRAGADIVAGSCMIRLPVVIDTVSYNLFYSHDAVVMRAVIDCNESNRCVSAFSLEKYSTTVP